MYKDEKPNNTLFTCGGKLLVLDMSFLVNTASNDPSSSQQEFESPISLESLNLTLPGNDEAPSTATSPTQAADDHLPELLSKTIRDFIRACMEHSSAPDGRKITMLLERYRLCLEQLVVLDELAAAGPPHGARWLREIGNLAVLANNIVADEASAISQYVLCSHNHA